MAIHFVENVTGKAKVAWAGAAILFLSALTACAVLPSLGFWGVWGDTKLVSTAVAMGFGLACMSTGAIIGRSLQQAVDRSPTRS